MTSMNEPEALVWGQGPVLFEIFLEPTCPFSGRAFGKLEALMQAAGEDRLTLRLWLHSQPWHMFSGVITRAVLAAAAGPGGKQDAWRLMAEVFARQPEFEFEDHARGPNMDRTPRQILQALEAGAIERLQILERVFGNDHQIGQHPRTHRTDRRSFAARFV